MRQRRRTIDQSIEQLVIAGGGKAERVSDGLLLRTCVLPPLPLEVEDCAITFAQYIMIKSSGGGGIVHVRNVMRAQVHNWYDRPSAYHTGPASETMEVSSSPLNVG